MQDASNRNLSLIGSIGRRVRSRHGAARRFGAASFALAFIFLLSEECQGATDCTECEDAQPAFLLTQLKVLDDGTKIYVSFELPYTTPGQCFFDEASEACRQDEDCYFRLTTTINEGSPTGGEPDWSKLGSLSQWKKVDSGAPAGSTGWRTQPHPYQSNDWIRTNLYPGCGKWAYHRLELEDKTADPDATIHTTPNVFKCLQCTTV